MGIKLVDRYMARCIAVPLAGTLAIAFMLLVIEELARLLNVVAKTGGSAPLIWQMLGYLIPEYLALALPIALILGVELAFRRLSHSSELDVFRGLGFSFERLLRVPYAFATALMAIAFLVSGFVQPLASYRFEQLGFRLDTGALGASINVGEFNHLGSNVTVKIDRSEMQGSRLFGIFLAVAEPDGTSITATGQTGRFVEAADRSLLLRLENGRMVEDSPEFATPRNLSFAVYDFPLQLPAMHSFRGRGGKESELTLPELGRRARDSGLDKHARLAAFATLNYRLAVLALFLLLPIFGVAFAASPRRSGSSTGVVLSVLLVVGYIKLEQYVLQTSVLHAISPAPIIWMPFALLMLLAWRLYWIAARVPGGCPTAALQNALIGLQQLARRIRARVESGQFIKRDMTGT